MKICCLGDIHYHGSYSDLDELTKNVEKECNNVNAIVVVGDLTSRGRLDYAEDVLIAIRIALGGARRFKVPILVVPGNHDIYLTPEELKERIDSETKLSRFNDFVEKLGYVALMKKPFILGNVGFVGSIGWYDYSFAPQWLNLPLEAYRKKAFDSKIWADREFVKLLFSDEEFTLKLLDNFEKHIKEIYDKVDKVVVVLHHVPFMELVHYKQVPEWDYFSAFMGSERFGHVIKKYGSKIKLVLYGHSHNGINTECKNVEGIKCCNCASPIPMLIEV